MSSAANGNRKKSTPTGSSKKVGVTSLPRKTSGLGGAVVDHFSQTRIKEVSLINADIIPSIKLIISQQIILFPLQSILLLLLLLNCSWTVVDVFCFAVEL